MPGNEHAANHSGPGLWALLERIGRDRWPKMLRADKGFASDGLMSRCEAEGLRYLMRLRLIKNVKRAIERLAGRRDWTDAGQCWLTSMRPTIDDNHALRAGGWFALLYALAYQPAEPGHLAARTGWNSRDRSRSSFDVTPAAATDRRK